MQNISKDVSTIIYFYLWKHDNDNLVQQYNRDWVHPDPTKSKLLNRCWDDNEHAFRCAYGLVANYRDLHTRYETGFEFIYKFQTANLPCSQYMLPNRYYFTSANNNNV